MLTVTVSAEMTSSIHEHNMLAVTGHGENNSQRHLHKPPTGNCQNRTRPCNNFAYINIHEMQTDWKSCTIKTKKTCH